MMSVVVASGGTTIACIAIAASARWSVLTAAVYTFGILCALQGGYLAGVLLSDAGEVAAWGRARAREVFVRQCHRWSGRRCKASGER
jgi:hypothetical protein